MAFKTDRWVKQIPSALTPAQMKEYEGKFRSADDPDNEVRLVSTDHGLKVMQLWDKKEIPVKALTDTYFNNAELSFSVQVIKGGSGKAKQVILLGTQVFNAVAD